MAPQRTILLHAQAPAQPALGAACNGCGVCCAAEPCPLGMLLSLKLRGACRMLRWEGARYGCGAMPRGDGLPGRLGRRLVARWIAAGAGCDSDLRAQRPAP